MGPSNESVAERLCVLYDPSTGVIIHRHSVTTLAGGRVLTDAEAEARIRHLAEGRGLDVSHAQVLHLDPAAWRQGARYQVDPATRTLTEQALHGGRSPPPER